MEWEPADLDTVATPEGDGEFDPQQPLTAGVVEPALEGLQVPPGAAPAAYDADASLDSGSELNAVIEAIDKVSRGKIQP